MLKRVLLLLNIFWGTLFIVAESKALKIGEKDFVTHIVKNKQPTDTFGDRRIAKSLDKGRGHLHKNKKFLNYIYPILTALLFAKIIVVPLILKMLIAATSSAFVMSKIALTTSVLMALSWLLGATRERAKLQIVQYPSNSSKKVYGGWNVKHSPNYETSYSDWAYDADESNDKSFFL